MGARDQGGGTEARLKAAGDIDAHPRGPSSSNGEISPVHDRYGSFSTEFSGVARGILPLRPRLRVHALIDGMGC